MPSSLPTKKPKALRLSKDFGIVESYETQLRKSISERNSLNALADLAAFARTLEDPESTSKAIYALYRVFVLLLSQDTTANIQDENSKIVKTWVNGQLQNYVEFLCSLLKDEERPLRVSLLPSSLISRAYPSV